jgi:Leucine-rich repeat (LRR) protein
MTRLKTSIKWALAFLLVCFIAHGEETIVLKDATFKSLCRVAEENTEKTRVEAFKARLTREEAEALFTQYPHIEWGLLLPIAHHGVRTDQTAFSTLHGNESAGHISDNFYLFKYAPHLLAIDLGHNKVRDLNFLKDFPHLKVLMLGQNELDDLSIIGELTELEYLELFSNGLTDISALSGLANLKDLNLCYNQIEDFSPLYALTGLERLYIRQATRDKEALQAAAEKLREKLPECEINITNNGTQGEWRKHPRFEVIQRIIKSGVYEPFEDEPQN